MTYNAMDFDSICRTCLAETADSKYLFSVQFINQENLTLSELLSACTSLEICETDGLPKQVCIQCAHFMLSSFTFQQQCHKSDSTLRALISGVSQTQYIQLKPVDNSEVNRLSPSLEINEILSNSSLQTEMVEDTLNDQEIVDNFSNDVDNLDDESPNEHVNIENRISDLVVSKNKGNDTPNNMKNSKDVNVITGSVDHINALGKCNVEIYNIKNEKEIKTDYRIRTNSLQETETRNKQGDETSLPLFPCEERDCAACFTTENDLKGHTKTHRGVYFCEPCNQRFSSASTLQRHDKNKHLKGKKVHLCNECGKEFGRSDDLKRHLLTHTGERPFGCDKCGKAFAQSFRLLEHMRAHSNERNFICAICGKAFKRYTSLLAHTKTHSGIKTHECKECGKKLCGAGSLAQHLKTHTGERNYICNYCGKAFACPSNLRTHKRIHTGERPYVCTTCGKAFPDKSRLYVHNRIHSGERPYVCSYCNKGCISSSSLKKHIRIHTGERPYGCKMCEKRFARSDDLNIHIKIHKGERNHVCEVCHKGFYQANSLKVHMRIHTGEKPYHCNLCNKSFSQSSSYSCHMKTHDIEKVMIPQKSEAIENEDIVQYL